MTATRSSHRAGIITCLVTSIVAALAMGGARAAGAPRGIHIALGADAATSATITWFTDTLQDPGSALEYGTTPSLGSSATGTSSPTPGVQARTHDVSLSGLAPGGTVYYRVGGSTQIRSFHTAPPAGAPFTFTVFADHGRTPQSISTVAQALAEDPDLVLMPGDLSYANGDQPDWDTWFDIMEPLAATRPVMVAPGNHETSSEGSSATYRNRLAMPGDELFYSFDYGNTHVLVLHSTLTHGAAEGVLPGMLAFAEADLIDASQRKSAGDIDFIVVMQHHPLYGNMAAETIEAERQRNVPLIAAEERLLQLYDVDVLLTGHNHHFERSKPMVAGQPTTDERRSYVDPTGYVEVITGGGGNSLYSFRDPNDFASWSAAYAKCFHYMEFRIEGSTLSADTISSSDNCFIRGTEYPTGSLIDTFSITRS